MKTNLKLEQIPCYSGEKIKILDAKIVEQILNIGRGQSCFSKA